MSDFLPINWKTWDHKEREEIASLANKHRPKQIAQYEENGHIIKVYEARYAAHSEFRNVMRWA